MQARCFEIEQFTLFSHLVVLQLSEPLKHQRKKQMRQIDQVLVYNLLQEQEVDLTTTNL